MISTNFKSLLLALLISAVGVLLAFQFSAKLPFAYAYGCDSYGYMRQAELFKTKGLIEGLQTEIKAENATFLVDIAKHINPQASRWAEMIAPHCHHYKAENQKIILQYPPGTGFFLSLLPHGKELQYLTMLLVLSVLAWWGYTNFRVLNGTVFLVSTASVGLLLATVSQFLVPSYSVPLTILLLAWISILALETAYIATIKNLTLAALLGLLVGFLLTVRIASVIILPAIAAIVYFQIRHAIQHKQFNIAVPLIGLCAFAVSLSPLLLSNWLNTGGIFDSTYNEYDKKINLASIELLARNLNYYLIENRAAALSILSLAALMIAWIVSRPNERTHRYITVSLVFVVILDLIFLSSKMVAIDYYFLPTAVFSLCAALLLYSQTVTRPTIVLRRQFLSRAMTLFCALLLLVVAYRLQTISAADVSLSVPNQLLEQDSIVYADDSGGAIHLQKQKYTAKINFGNYCMREQLISRVQAAGRTQYFVNDSPKMNETIEAIGIERFKKIGVATSAHFKFDVLQLLPFDASAIPKINCDFGSEPEIVKHVQLQPSGSAQGKLFVGHVTITNFSNTPFSTLPNAFPVRLSWRFVESGDQSSKVPWLGRQDLRTILKPTIPYQVPVSIHLPEKEGTYTLEFSLVQEGHVWLHDRGMPIAKLNVRVGP